MWIIAFGYILILIVVCVAIYLFITDEIHHRKMRRLWREYGWIDEHGKHIPYELRKESIDVTSN